MEQLRADIIASPRYRLLYKDIPYEEWLIKTIKSYKRFDVEYEMSMIRKTEDINQEELDRIIEVGEMVHPVKKIENKLKIVVEMLCFFKYF